MIDLHGFVSVIDQLGGLDIYVEKSFTDYLYPTENYRWQTIVFKQGWTHMSGDMALKYSRSRHSQQNNEGSDFARARRQQKVIQAVIDTAQKQENLQNPKKVFEILNTIASSVLVNQLTPEDVQAAVNILKDKGKPASYSVVLDPAAANKTLIQVGGYGTGYTLTSKAGVNNWGPTKQFVKDFVTEPTFIEKNLAIPVYNAKSGSFTAKYRSITSRFFYNKFYNGGSFAEIAGDVVYNHGGKDYELMGKFIAGTLGYSYVEPTAEMNVPRPKDTPIVIVLGK
jgi:hypothetical protein